MTKRLGTAEPDGGKVKIVEHDDLYLAFFLDRRVAHAGPLVGRKLIVL